MEFTGGVGLKIDLREGHIDLLEFPLVERPRIERITDHDQSGKPPLNLSLAHLMLMRVVPVQPHTVLVLRDREDRLIHFAYFVLDIDVVPLTQIRSVGPMVVEVRNKDGIVGVVIRARIGQPVIDVQFQRIARPDLKHRPGEARLVRSARGIIVKLIRHGVHTFIG